MPMGIVSDEELVRQIKDSSINIDKTELVKTGEIIDIPNKGRKDGDVNVPNSLRNLIGITSVEDNRTEAVNLAANFGISSSSVSAYSDGAKSTSSYATRPNLDVINRSKESLAKLARNRLRKALNNITEDKMATTTVRELAGVAKDMAIVAKHMDTTVDDNTEQKSQVQFVFYAPGSKSESHYETVIAKDNF